jgi:hypothetical protein
MVTRVTGCKLGLITGLRLAQTNTGSSSQHDWGFVTVADDVSVPVDGLKAKPEAVSEMLTKSTR